MLRMFPAFISLVLLYTSCTARHATTAASAQTQAPKDTQIPASPYDNKKPVSPENPIYIMQTPDTITTASGLKYVILKHNGTGKKPKTGDKVSVHYRGYLADKTEFDNSFKRGQPFEFELGRGRVIPGWEEGIALLNEGDSALLIIPAALGYGSRAIGAIPANSTLYFEVELVAIKEPVTVHPYPYQGKEKHTTPSGLEYYVIKEGTGKQAYKGATVKVHYTGYLLDGKIFDSSVLREEPLEFQVGVGMVIKGWDEGISMMKVGSMYRFIIPPALGYGSQEIAGAIPANSTLIFDCELVDVK